MPTYEYACTKCGHQFEHFQSMRDAPLRKCPQCGKNSLKRLVGAGAGLIFKGTGFYITDYKKSPEKAASGDKTPSATSTSDPVQPVKGRPAELKPEAKPASTPAKEAPKKK